MEKEDNLIVIFLLSYIALWLVVLFSIFGGQPEGVYWKMERYQKEQQAEIKQLQTEIQSIKDKKWHR